MNSPELFLNPLFWLLAVIGVFFTGISKSGFAGGAGVVAVPLLALLAPPTMAIVLMLPLLLLMDAQTIAYHRRNLALDELKIIVPAALVGVVVGSAVLSELSDQLLQLLLGVLCLAFALLQAIKPHMKSYAAAGWVLGGLAGITSTLIHAGGPPLNIYLATRKLPRAVWISTAAVFFAAINASKVFAYAAIDLWSFDLLLVGLALSPVALAGVLAGHRIQERISEAAFVRVVMGCLAISGLLLIAKSGKVAW